MAHTFEGNSFRHPVTAKAMHYFVASLTLTSRKIVHKLAIFTIFSAKFSSKTLLAVLLTHIINAAI